MARFNDAIIRDLYKLSTQIQTNDQKLLSDVGSDKLIDLHSFIENTLYSLGAFSHLKPETQARFSRDGTPAGYRQKAADYLKKIRAYASSSRSLSSCCCMSDFEKIFYAAEILFHESAAVQAVNPVHPQQLPAMAFGPGAPVTPSSEVAQLGYQAASL